MTDLKDATLIEIQEHLFKQNLVAVPIDILTEQQTEKVALNLTEDAARLASHAKSLRERFDYRFRREAADIDRHLLAENERLRKHVDDAWRKLEDVIKPAEPAA
jgi:hypothetical protein